MRKLCAGLDIGMTTFCQGLELGALAQPASELFDLIAAQPAAVQAMARGVLRELFTLLDGDAGAR